MRLWHVDLVDKLPSVKDYKGCSNQLGGQHTEVRMILGMRKKRGHVNHSTINYVNNYSDSYLFAYGLVVIEEMKKRGFNVSESIEAEYLSDEKAVEIFHSYKEKHINIFREHNEEYMKECLENLGRKGIYIGKEQSTNNK